MTHRINARIGEDLAAKIEHLRRHTNQSVTEIVRASVELYYERFRDKGQGAARILEDSGFVACGDDSEDLSAHYKQRLHDSLSRKTDS